MAKADKHEVRVRSEDHATRLSTALIHEEVAFDVRPEPNGWWLIRATTTEAFTRWMVDHLVQSTALAPEVRG